MNTRRTIWASNHGPIPKGWVVVNLNGNPTDNRLENLACVPRNPRHIGEVIAPFKERVIKLELMLKEFLSNGSK
jgi:hypothetical protein